MLSIKIENDASAIRTRSRIFVKPVSLQAACWCNTSILRASTMYVGRVQEQALPGMMLDVLMKDISWVGDLPGALRVQYDNQARPGATKRTLPFGTGQKQSSTNSK